MQETKRQLCLDKYVRLNQSQHSHLWASTPLEPGILFTEKPKTCKETLTARAFCSYVCMVFRAVHVEFIEELSSFSFIIAQCRFMAIRGPVK